MKKKLSPPYAYYQAIRHQLHSYPELAYQEERTAEIVAYELEKLGLIVKTKIGKTGVEAVLDSKRPGKTIALRADMDALPIEEETSLSYRSSRTGKMHACGHDGHTACLLASANLLSQQKERLKGKIKFIFQPAEEGGRGALAMIKEGILESPSVDAIFAFHNYPGIPVGQVLVKPGCTLYGNYEFIIHIRGKGGHAAQPELVRNPILIGALLINKIDTVKHFFQKEEPPIISVTRFNSGIANNVVPSTATIQGTIRAASCRAAEIANQLIMEEIKELIKHYQIDIEMECNEKTPVTISTIPETELVRTQAILLLGKEQVKTKAAPARASEDFSYFLQKIPGCYFFIGNGEASAACHHPSYDFNDEVIPIAASLLTNIAIAYLESSKP